jgi:hypothetical protein
MRRVVLVLRNNLSVCLSVIIMESAKLELFLPTWSDITVDRDMRLCLRLRL